MKCFICGRSFNRSPTGLPKFWVASIPSGAQVKVHKACQDSARNLGKLSDPLDHHSWGWNAHVTPPASNPDESR